jgi:hypothetical protein
MSTAKELLGTRTSLTTTALDSLAGATYVSAGTITHASSSKVPLDCLLEVKVTPGTVSSNKQVVVFAKVSLDGSNQTTGPESGTTTTDEPNLKFIGVVPCNTNSAAQTNIFSLRGALGFIPYASEIVVKNETGASLASSGHHVYYQDVTGDLT